MITLLLSSKSILIILSNFWLIGDKICPLFNLFLSVTVWLTNPLPLNSIFAWSELSQVWSRLWQNESHFLFVMSSGKSPYFHLFIFCYLFSVPPLFLIKVYPIPILPTRLLNADPDCGYPQESDAAVSCPQHYDFYPNGVVFVRPREGLPPFFCKATRNTIQRTLGLCPQKSFNRAEKGIEFLVLTNKWLQIITFMIILWHR